MKKIRNEDVKGAVVFVGLVTLRYISVQPTLETSSPRIWEHRGEQ